MARIASFPSLGYHVAVVFRFSPTVTGIAFLTAFLAALANGRQEPDPVALLQDVTRLYSQAKQYHVEVHLSEDFKGELSGNWTNSFQTAIVAPGGRYRFEARGPHYSWVQISDGKTESIYNAISKEYVQKHAASSHQPDSFGKNTLSFEQDQLVDAQSIPEHIVDEIGAVRNPELVRSEVLSFGNDSIECFVIQGQGKYRSGWEPDTSWELTLWIEKRSNYVRKIEEHWKGELVKGDSSHYTRANVEVYPVVDLETPVMPQSLFEFVAAPGAKRVAAFEHTRALPLRQRSQLVGKMAPDVALSSPDGNLVHLSSFHGKPILIEFWATWCAPCVQAFGKLEQIYSRATSQGIVVITIDEDSQPEKAVAFLASHHKPSWLNFHDDGEINRSLPGNGLPQFILIDVSGKVAYETSGFDESELQAAIGRLGLGYSSLNKKDTR
jgi:thiol-disulfide isomerase/thioredoxin